MENTAAVVFVEVILFRWTNVVVTDGFVSILSPSAVDTTLVRIKGETQIYNIVYLTSNLTR